MPERHAAAPAHAPDPWCVTTRIDDEPVPILLVHSRHGAPLYLGWRSDTRTRGLFFQDADGAVHEYDLRHLNTHPDAAVQRFSHAASRWTTDLTAAAAGTLAALLGDVDSAQLHRALVSPVVEMTVYEVHLPVVTQEVQLATTSLLLPAGMTRQEVLAEARADWQRDSQRWETAYHATLGAGQLLTEHPEHETHLQPSVTMEGQEMGDETPTPERPGAGTQP